jgi:hypothetical protein
MPSEKTIVKYFTDYRADIVLDAFFEAPIPKEEPAPPGPVRFIVQNTLGLPSVKVYYKDINGVDSQTIVESVVTLDIEFNSKVSIVRNDSVNYNIEKIEIFDAEENLVKTSTSNLFDIEGIQREHTAIVTSVEILTIEDAALLLSDLQNAVYDWNTEEQSEYFIEIRTQKASYVKYFFPNQPGADQDGAIKVPVNSEGSATISLKNPNAIGIYELVVFAGNGQLGDGGVTRASFNVYRQRFYGQPDVTNIVYDRNITEADLSPLKFSFNFKLDTINSEGVDVYLGENFISNITISEGKGGVSYSATELYNAYKTYFNETNTSYEVTFSFRPYFNGIGGKIVGKSESVTVFVQRAKYLISKQEALNTFSGAFSKLFSGGATKVNYEDKIIFEDDKHLYYSIRFDNDNSYLISNIASDTFTFSLENGKVVPTDYEIDPQSGSTRRKRNQIDYGSLVVKLLEPLPTDITNNSLIWISKQIIPTIVESIILTDTDFDKCIPLKPNFGVDILDETGYEFFEQIVSSGSVTSQDIVNQYVSKSKFSLEELNIEYTSGSDVDSVNFLKFENFINFGGAVSRIENFQYKLETIESWEDKIIASTYSPTTLVQSTSSISLLTSASYNDKITAVKNGFDGFEKTMYVDYSITSSNASFFPSQVDAASVYDKINRNYLIRHIPTYLQQDEENGEYLLFLEMIGQHFDIIWAYINGISRLRRVTHKSTDGISDKLVHTLLESFGWDPKQPFSGQQLWKHAFGLNEDGTTTSNKNVLGDNVSASYTPETARNEVWRRILNNLPYLLKHKGTRKAINAIIACYGVPSSLLTIVEFGGPGNIDAASTKYTYEDRTAALNIARDEYLTVDWKEGTSFNDPDAIELRFRTSKLPFVTPQLTTLYQTQSLVNIGGQGSGIWNVKLVPSGSTIYGDIVFQMSASSNTYISPGVVNSGLELVSMSIQNVPIFDTEFKHFTIQREVISRDEYVGNTLTRSLDYEQYTMYYKQANGDRISLSESDTLELLITTGSDSLVSNAKYYTGIGWLSGSTINFGGQNAGGISGSIDEVRIWGGALSESVVTSHTLNPDTIFGNDVYSSTSDLFFRLDFEYPKNRQISGSGVTSGDMFIKNVAPFVTYETSSDSNGKQKVASGYSGYATASIFTTASSYPYQYEVYERFVTAEVPSIGFVGKDKVRLEDITLNGQLSYKARATKKSFDRAPMDSNRLGLFFSPVKEINLDILRSLGPINIGDYIGDWDDEYGTDTYKDLDQLRNYYFERTQLNFDEYIKLIKSIDKSLFDMLDQVIPARANVSKGLLIEPSLLERSKIKITKPVADNIYHTASIDTREFADITLTVPTYESILDINNNITITSAIPTYTGSYSVGDMIHVSTEYPTYMGEYSIINNLTSSATIISNLNNEGAVVINIDCGLKEPTILGEVDLEDAYQQVGNDPDSPFNKGFGIVGEGGAVDRTYFDDNSNLILTERSNAYIIKVKYTRSIPRRVPLGGLSGSLFRNTKLSATDKVVLEKIDRFESKLILIDQMDYSLIPSAYRRPLQHSFYTDIVTNLGTYPYKNGVIVEIRPFVGYTSGHYSNTKDTARGMENSFFNGSKQTSLTTLDGTPAVETFSTNPNRLKVGPAGRGSGEPILEVD